MHRHGQPRRHVRGHPASGRGRGGGAGRASISSASTGSMRRSRRDGSRTWSAPPTSIACRRMVRVPGHAPEAIAAALDSGAQGVLVPRVSTAAQAKAAVKASRYPPHRRARRRPGPGRRLRLSHPRLSCRRPTTELVVAVQVETAEGLANIDAIAAVDGVDVIFVGPGDLSVSIDAIGPRGSRQARRRDPRPSSPRRSHTGKTAGIFCARPDRRRPDGRPTGTSFFMLASDTMFLGAAAAASAAARDELKADLSEADKAKAEQPDERTF